MSEEGNQQGVFDDQQEDHLIGENGEGEGERLAILDDDNNDDQAEEASVNPISPSPGEESNGIKEDQKRCLSVAEQPAASDSRSRHSSHDHSEDNTRSRSSEINGAKRSRSGRDYDSSQRKKSSVTGTTMMLVSYCAGRS